MKNQHAFRTRIGKEIVAEFTLAMKPKPVTLVFALGMPTSPGVKDLLFAFAALGYNSVCPRYRGSWESSGRMFAKEPTEDILETIEQLKKPLVSLWDKSEFKLSEDVIVIGSSFGGPAALLLSKHPNVKKVIGVCPVLDWRDESPDEPFDFLKVFVSEAFGEGYRISKNGWEKLQSGDFYNPATSLEKIDPKKVTIFYSTDDGSVTANSVKNFKKSCPVTLVSLGKQGHTGVSTLLTPKFLPKLKSALKL